MIVTHTTLKALAKGDCSVMAEERPTILLDECVTRRVAIGQLTGVSYVHSVKEQGLGWGAKDPDIRRHAEINGYILATKDFKNLCACLEQNIQAALVYHGKAYIIKIDDIVRLGEELPPGAVPYLPAMGFKKSPVTACRMREPYRCMICNAKCFSEKRLKKHMRKVHKKPSVFARMKSILGRFASGF